MRLKSVSGCTFIDQGYDMAFCWIAPARLGASENQSFNEPADMLNAKCIIIWGSNPLESVPQTWHFISEAQKQGCDVITIDPIWTATASKSNAYVPLRPGSDAALGIGLCRAAIEEGLLDEDFLRKSSDAPFLVKESDGKFLRLSDLGKVADSATDAIVVCDQDGNADVPANIQNPALEGSFEIEGHKVTTVLSLVKRRAMEYTLERVEELTTVPVETIKDIARRYAKGPSTILHGYGMDHYVNGHYSYTASMTLAMLTGNVGRAGSSCGWCYTVGQTVLNGAVPVPEAYRGAKPGPTLVGTDLPEVVDSKEYAGEPLDIKSVLVYSHNPLGNTAQRNRMIEAYKKLELVIVCDMFMSETAQWADIVLPVAYWFETEDIVGSNTQHPFITYQEKAVDPAFETKPDYEIVRLLAGELGLADCFPSAEEYMERLLDWDGAKAKGISLEKLKADKVLRAYKPTQIHGEGGVFPTATKRVHMYLENPIPRIQHKQIIDTNKERMLYFEPPHEAWFENDLFQKYPLVCVNKHARWRTHSQFAKVEALRELDPEPLVYLSRADADERGIVTGDIVEVFNDRGHVIIKAQIAEEVPPGIINIPKGWHEDQFIGGHYQELTSNFTNPMAKNNAYYDTLIQVRKA
jgi:molybdopterin-containing oxidoreductase family molybdopterin binding subunit